MHKKKLLFKDMLKKAVAYILAAVTLIVAIPLVSHLETSAVNTQKPYIMLDGERVESVLLNENAKLRLTAVSPEVEGDFNWQIAHPSKPDLWVNIDGAASNKLWLTSALISSMTNASGVAQLRCRVSSDGAETFSNPLPITLSYNISSEKSEAVISGEPQRRKMAMRAAGVEPTTYSVVVNYLFSDGTIAFEPYGATIASGSNFTEPIPSPSIVGYEPYILIDDEYVRADTVYPEIYNADRNTTFNVVYMPAMVKYFVHHHKQDIYDDFYSVDPDEITEGTAPTGTKVGDGLALTEEEWPGFKSLAYERLEVAADSSTAIEIRYDRKYYLVEFDMNGGYGAEPFYTRFETTIGTNIPTRHGFIFDGWELVSYGGREPTNEQKSIYDINGKTISVPAANLTYRAKWIVGETKYTMVFWAENADDSGYSYWGHIDDISAMSGDVVSARDLISQVSGIDDEAYFEFNAQKSDKNIIVEGDGSTVVNVYYTRKLYTITFVAPGQCILELNHKHTDACYESICGLSHVHSSDCVLTLVCPKSEHTEHTDACITCGKTIHIHGGDGCACNQTEHTHTKDCWYEAGSEVDKPRNAPSNPKNGQIYRRINTYYIYLFNSWHTFLGQDVYSGQVLKPDCNLDEHTHGVNCSCDKEAHSHTDSCYKDTLHVHGDTCYNYSCGEDEHVHTSACNRLICALPTNHTSHSYSCNSSSQNSTVKLLKVKYGQSIGDIWPITDNHNVVYNKGQRWTPSSSSYYSNVLVYISQMPPDDFTLTLSTSSADSYTMEYYLQVLPGEQGTETFNGKSYVLNNTIVANYNYITKDEDFFNIKGFTQAGSSPSFSSNGQINIGGGTVKFYYDRIVDHVLEFNNNGEVLSDKTLKGIPYGAPLTEYNFTPEYPSNLEPNAYEFSGWYTSPGCFDGTEVDWNSIKMSEGDMMLYAKWTPTIHKVRIFLEAEKQTQIGDTLLIPHGSFADAPEGSITNEGYIFQGWFYMEDDVEKAFVFKGIPINKDMDVYAKWSSHVEIEYSVFYKLKGTDIQVADPTINTSIAGNNKTFEAKAGDALYEAYRIGFYPDVRSHTVTMSPTGDHSFTFWYDYVESMPYTVRYVDEAGNDVHPKKVVNHNRLSVVTETFVRVNGMMPDAYQKRLILTSNGENELIFHYTNDETHAYYRVVHYIQNVNDDNYREYISEEAAGVINDEYVFNAIHITGFNYAPEKTKVTGAVPTVTDDSVTAILGNEGLLIEFYYDRVPATYIVQYVDSNLNPITEEKVGKGTFGEQVLEYAPDLSAIGYSLVSENLKFLTLSAAEDRNVIVFMYAETNATIKYEIIGPANCGTLIPQTENIKAVTGTVGGSLPTAREGFMFAGWYLDAACTQEVDKNLIGEDNRLVPQKQGEIWRDITYYAKFDALQTNLTISVNSLYHTDIDQSFLFTIKGIAAETADVNLTVSITGNDSVTIADLPVGKYTITYHNDWAWRFQREDNLREYTLEYNGGDNHLIYSASKHNDKWLDGLHSINNIF